MAAKSIRRVGLLVRSKGLKMADLPVYLLERQYFPDKTSGRIYSPLGGLVATTEELPRNGGDRLTSCIPEGNYRVSGGLDKYRIKMLTQKEDLPEEFRLIIEQK